MRESVERDERLRQPSEFGLEEKSWRLASIMRAGRIFIWVPVACGGATGLAILAGARGEDRPNVLWFIVAAVCVYALAYRFYSNFIATRVLELDDRNLTPAVRLSN